MLWSLAVLAALTAADFSEAQDISGTLEPELADRTDIIFFSDFEEPDWVNHFSSGTQDRYASGLLSETTDPGIVFAGTRSGRSFHPQGEHSGGAAMYYPAQGEDEAYWRITFMLADDFVIEPANAMKIMWLYSYRPDDEYACTAGVPPTGTDCASCHIVIEQNMQLHFYVYHLDQSGGYGDEPALDLNGGVSLTPGVWTTLELGVRLNDVGERNGWVRAWVNGVLEGEMADLRFRTVPDLQIRRASVDAYFGGAGDINTSPQDQYSTFDNVVLARGYVGPMEPGPHDGEDAPEAVVEPEPQTEPPADGVVDAGPSDVGDEDEPVDVEGDGGCACALVL